MDEVRELDVQHCMHLSLAYNIGLHSLVHKGRFASSRILLVLAAICNIRHVLPKSPCKCIHKPMLSIIYNRQIYMRIYG